MAQSKPTTASAENSSKDFVLRFLVVNEKQKTRIIKKEERDYECRIQGVSVMNDKLMVAEDIRYAAYVRVYDLHTLTLQNSIYCSEGNNFNGMTCCAHNQTIYLTCQFGIYLIDFNNEPHLSLRMSNVKGMRGLSITAENTLLVTTCINYQVCRVLEYTTDDRQLIREIKLDRSIKFAWHTIRLSTDPFIICHGNGESSLHRLCVISSEGQIIKSYGGEKGEGEGQLNKSCYLAIDKKNGVVFVADHGNNRVLMFTKDLTLLGQVQTSERLSNPTCIDFDSNSDQLIIGEESGRVLIITASN